MRLFFDSSVWVLRSMPTERGSRFDRNEFASPCPGRAYEEVYRPRKARAVAQALRVVGYTTQQIKARRLSPSVLAWDVCFRMSQALELLRKKPVVRRVA